MGGKQTWGAAVVVMATACSLGSYGESADMPDPGDAGASSDATGAEAAGDSGDIGAPCPSGGTARPVTAFNATPDPAAINGPSCDIDNALVADGLVAGVDRDDAPTGNIAGREVNGCVGVEFRPSDVLDGIVVTAKPVANACAASPCVAPECGTGWSMLVFAGPARDALSFLGEVALTGAELSTYRVAVPPTIVASVAVVCRTSVATQRDDVGVDAILGSCR
jgi:hypothetical protein